ncbi:hypothetical protein [Longimicrobium sp.]|uniref:hypothetical protein n=1 Tax=Longimicrobium sp. TaxID=2029185 RepID=UPI002B582B66|nr:hypothetical protein [Longimicrobium sp.]HSU15724.1 hypothetical protein [Longimicrobium sp.]
MSRPDDDRIPAAAHDDELSVDELEVVAGGVEGDNTNCVYACTVNSGCKAAASAI